jgi:hypothetical protein
MKQMQGAEDRSIRGALWARLSMSFRAAANLALGEQGSGVEPYRAATNLALGEQGSGVVLTR